MQYVFLIRSRAGGKKYFTRRSRVKYFFPPAGERIKNTYCMAKRPFLFLLLIYMRFLTIFLRKKTRDSFLVRITTVSESKLSQTDGIDSVWCISILIDFLSYYAWTLMSYWILFTFLLKGHSGADWPIFFSRSIKSLIYNIFTYKGWTLNFYRKGSEIWSFILTLGNSKLCR